MQAAAKAARTEMMDRMRTNKAARGTPRSGDQRAGKGQHPRSEGGNAQHQERRRPDHHAQRRDDSQPRGENAHLGTQLGRMGMDQPRGARDHGGQPDPMRTSVDIMGQRGRRGGSGGSGGGGNRSRGPRGGAPRY